MSQPVDKAAAAEAEHEAALQRAMAASPARRGEDTGDHKQRVRKEMADAVAPTISMEQLGTP